MHIFQQVILKEERFPGHDTQQAPAQTLPCPKGSTVLIRDALTVPEIAF